jgi:DNA modification methylase
VLGLETSPALYVEHIVEIFREIWRVLRDDGVAWVNMGDSYAGSGRGPSGKTGIQGQEKRQGFHSPKVVIPEGLKRKDKFGMPWRVAFALQDDGWYLRQDVIWFKLNPRPESAEDRPTSSHEYIFLLSKRDIYFYDGDAIREPSQDKAGLERFKGQTGISKNGYEQEKWETRDGTLACPPPTMKNRNYNPAGRNKRSVWTLPVARYKGSHFATFPPSIPEICIKAGSSERGCCPKCGAGWERVTEKETSFEGGSGRAGRTAEEVNASGKGAGKQHGENLKLGPVNTITTTGWEPGCNCNMAYPDIVCARDDPAYVPYDPIPCTVLDPFWGVGTTSLVAERLGRDSIGCELNPEYAEQGANRVRDDAPLFNQVEIIK